MAARVDKLTLVLGGSQRCCENASLTALSTLTSLLAQLIIVLLELLMLLLDEGKLHGDRICCILHAYMHTH